MSAPTACWQPFPFFDRTCEEVASDHRRREADAVLGIIAPLALQLSHKRVCLLDPPSSTPSLHCPASPNVRSSASARSAPIGRADERLRV
jgi:hypothetical protein